MPTVRSGPLTGLAGQVVLVAVLHRTVGLGGAGALAALVYGLVTCVALSRGLERSGSSRLGPADRVTVLVARRPLVIDVDALVAGPAARHLLNGSARPRAPTG